MNIIKTAEGIYHVYGGNRDDAMLYRYGILARDGNLPDDGGCQTIDSGVALTAKRTTEFLILHRTEGYRITIPLTEKERLFGLGDATRADVMVRGIRVEMYIENVKSYGPMPILMSSDGWAFVLNSTFRSIFDCAATDKDNVVIDVAGGNPDFYLFRADSLRELLAKVTTVTGRAEMLPKFAYGLTLVQNEETDERSLLWDIRTMRDRNIPCDTMGLEPAWMEKRYDFSTNKEWNKTKFPLPSWYPKNSADNFTFFFPMRKMGMQLSLWLCNDYDLLFEEDRQVAKAKAEAETADGIADTNETVNGVTGNEPIFDEHFSGANYQDNITKRDEPWFEHLKKFVDNGAAAFKLDGANQVVPHPHKLWGGKYLDREVHNIYPVLLAKQITNGFADYTDRRLLLYTSGAYIGTQKYAATWSGDTGGDQGTLVSLMNYAMCGHSNTACDIDINDIQSIHYGFLNPWAQYFCWSNWRYPWFLGEETENMVRFYSTMRSKLFPYFYTMAHKAYETGLPILRPLPLVYGNTDRYDHEKNAFMLGDCMYVGAFDMNLKLPEGKWFDLFTGKVYEGDIVYDIPEGRGGALFARSGSVFVTMKPQKYILEKAHDYEINVCVPTAETLPDTEFSLYEDDGFTYDYQKGLYAETKMTLTDITENSCRLTVYQRTGNFPGRPDNGSNIIKNSIPSIQPLAEERDMTVTILGRKPREIRMNGRPCTVTSDRGNLSVLLPAELHHSGDVVLDIIM